MFYKSETKSVAQSHKARHLMSVMLYLKVLSEFSPELGAGLSSRRLAVASCGNAGLAAATIAAAAQWPIDVFVPPNASPVVLARLRELGAEVQLCHKEPGVEGDPCMHAFAAAIEAGSIPFSVQGSANGLVVEGSNTILFEILTALRRDHGIDRIGALYTQVGGGAFGSGIIQGLRQAVSLGALPEMPVFNTVQTEGGHPLHRAHEAIVQTCLDGTAAPENQARHEAMARAVQERGSYMFPWLDPHSIAHGILDDETYDWANLCDGMLQTGGESIVVSDDRVCEAAAIAHGDMGVDCCHTGAAGLAGLLHQRAKGTFKTAEGPAVVILTGHNRDGKKAWPEEAKL